MQVEERGRAEMLAPIALVLSRPSVVISCTSFRPKEMQWDTISSKQSRRSSQGRTHMAQRRFKALTRRRARLSCGAVSSGQFAIYFSRFILVIGDWVAAAQLG